MQQFLAVADAMRARDVACVPHNPSDPIAHGATLQACAAAGLAWVEAQYRETPHFDALTSPATLPVVAGVVDIPDAPGLGLALDASRIAALAQESAAAQQPSAANRFLAPKS